MTLRYIKEGIEFPIQSEMYKHIENEFLIPKYVTFNIESRNNLDINHVLYKNEHKFSFISNKGKILRIINL